LKSRRTAFLVELVFHRPKVTAVPVEIGKAVPANGCRADERLAGRGFGVVLARGKGHLSLLLRDWVEGLGRLLRVDAGMTKPVLPTTPESSRFSNGNTPTVVVNRMSEAVTSVPA
jgi:hypothetical protein